MKSNKILLIGILLAAPLSCRFLSPERPPSETLEVTTASRTYENDVFIFNIPDGWGMALFGGEYYDLGVEKKA